MTEEPIRVLFLCTGNSCRSQMAEALLRQRGGERFDVHSAGCIPSGVHPLTIQALAEMGIDAESQCSKHWNVYLHEPPFDYVITVCDYAAQICPTFPGEGRRLHWSFEDPVAVPGSEPERMRAFCRVRDQIGERIQQFVDTITSR